MNSALPLAAHPAKEYQDQPATITIGNHSVLEDVTWSGWGENTAARSATLIGVECEPTCADGSETREPAQLEASEPKFTPEDVRYYSRLWILPADEKPYVVEVQGW